MEGFWLVVVAVAWWLEWWSVDLSMWVSNVSLVIHVACKEIKEIFLWISRFFKVSMVHLCFLSSGIFFSFLAHFEISVKETECGNDEYNEEVHNLECYISLQFHVLPFSLICGGHWDVFTDKFSGCRWSSNGSDNLGWGFTTLCWCWSMNWKLKLIKEVISDFKGVWADFSFNNSFLVCDSGDFFNSTWNCIQVPFISWSIFSFFFETLNMDLTSFKVNTKAHFLQTCETIGIFCIIVLPELFSSFITLQTIHNTWKHLLHR